MNTGLRRPRGSRLNIVSCCKCIFRHSLPIKVSSDFVVTVYLAMASARDRLRHIVCAYIQGPRYLPGLPYRLLFISLVPSHSSGLFLHRICWRSSLRLSDFRILGFCLPPLGFIDVFHKCATQAVRKVKKELVWGVSLQITTT